MKTLLLILLVVLCSCDYQVQVKGESAVKKLNNSANLKETNFATNYSNLNDIVTVNHDNHWFIIWRSSNCGGLIHHPDCPTCRLTKTQKRVD